MVPFSKQAAEVICVGTKDIFSFGLDVKKNIDEVTVNSFGEEWKKFDSFDAAELEKIGNDYFDILPQLLRDPSTVVLDLGCGTGRWAAYLAPSVGFIECIDPSDAVYSAAKLLKPFDNIRISKVDIDNLPFPDNSFDLVYSLGVLHHIPDTAQAMKDCVKKVKPGGYFLVYIYYSLDNRGGFYKSLFRLSAIFRKGISAMPGKMKRVVCDAIALTVYYPMARSAKLLSSLGAKRLSSKVPLSYYMDKSFWIMKNDALDRFGTPLEQRFSKMQIADMMRSAGLAEIKFSDKEPYWHAIGRKV